MIKLNEHHLEYFKNGESENIKFWKRLNIKPKFKNKTILDFGCGLGSLTINVAKKFPKKIIGIDLEKEFIEFANRNLNTNFNELNKIVEFKKLDLLKKKFHKKFDIIISKDTFEHSVNLDKILEKFYAILNTNGYVYLGFGPLYNFLNGDHARTGLVIPWLHALLPEKFIIKFYNLKNKKKINNITELGLNKYSLAKYKEIFNSSKFKILYFKTNLSDHPASKIFNLFKDIPILDEYFTNNIYCVLKKTF